MWTNNECGLIVRPRDTLKRDLLNFICPAGSRSADVVSSSTKRPRKDDIGEGAALLLGFANAKSPEESDAHDKAIICKREQDAGESVVPIVNDQDTARNPVIPGRPVEEGWAWEKSCHEGLFTFHDGRKRWYHCMYCEVMSTFFF